MDPMEFTDAELAELRGAICLNNSEPDCNDRDAMIDAYRSNFEKLCGIVLLTMALLLDKEIARRAAKK